jgi:hypothetical protein
MRMKFEYRMKQPAPIEVMNSAVPRRYRRRSRRIAPSRVTMLVVTVGPSVRPKEPHHPIGPA